MRMIGYCLSCRKIKQVRVGPGWTTKMKVPYGTCAQCEEKGR